jgi:uncharacterized membrane protein YdfJ with MMPL/SSD domain
MENLMQIISVPVITAIVYGIIELYKYTVQNRESFVRLIPVIATVLGAVLGIVAFYAVRDIIAADNVFTALLSGGASGAAATGTNQIFKQLSKKNETEEEGNDKEDGERNGE